MTLPFTPFHMGAGLVVKPGMDRNFSVITFGIAQIAMDVEPGIGMLTGAAVLHGPSHTVLGSLVIACIVMLVSPWACCLLLKRWNKEVTHYGLARWVQQETPPKKAVVLGAFFGTLSHVALDGLIHHDIQPLLPFSGSNPLAGLVAHDAVYQACVVAGVLGAAAWCAEGVVTKGGKPFTKQTIYKMLHNRMYLGEIVHKGQSFPGQHQAIVTHAQWDAVHALIATDGIERRRETNDRQREPVLLRGLCCSRPMANGWCPATPSRRARPTATTPRSDTGALARGPASTGHNRQRLLRNW
ncbi:recombinase family protein [Quisquiliibacterium transsilvanicum]